MNRTNKLVYVNPLVWCRDAKIVIKRMLNMYNHTKGELGAN